MPTQRIYVEGNIDEVEMFIETLVRFIKSMSASYPNARVNRLARTGEYHVYLGKRE